MLIKQTSPDSNVMDVFTGNGWLNWHRFLVTQSNGKLYLKLIKGVPMVRDEYQQLYDKLK